MANILYRGSTAPSSTNTAGANNAPLTNDQIDKNFYALDSAKFEKSGGTVSGNLVVAGDLTIAKTVCCTQSESEPAPMTSRSAPRTAPT